MFDFLLLDDFQQDSIISYYFIFFSLGYAGFVFYLNHVKANKMQAVYGCCIIVTHHHKNY